MLLSVPITPFTIACKIKNDLTKSFEGELLVILWLTFLLDIFTSMLIPKIFHRNCQAVVAMNIFCY